jgi:hypothetical protein
MKISNEEQAFELLALALSEDATPRKIDFSGWPNLNIVLVGESFHGTVTPGVMKGLLEFQSSIYRSYAVAKYGIPDARKLSDDERLDLEIVVHVESGSSILDVDIQSIIEKLIESVGARMTPAELAILVAILALIWSGTTILKKFLNDRKEIALKKLDEDGRAQLVEALVSMSREDKERMRIFATALNENSRISIAAGIAQDGKADLLKGLSEADQVTVQGQSFSGDAIRHMTRNARRKAAEIDLEGLFFIRKVDTTDPLMTRVRVEDIGDRSTIDANVQDDLLTLRKKKALQDAEWNRHPVRLAINAKMLDDEIRDAVITEVEALSEDELGSLSRSRATLSD